MPNLPEKIKITFENKHMQLFAYTINELISYLSSQQSPEGVCPTCKAELPPKKCICNTESSYLSPQNACPVHIPSKYLTPSKSPLEELRGCECPAKNEDIHFPNCFKCKLDTLRTLIKQIEVKGNEKEAFGYECAKMDIISLIDSLSENN